jgi:hypothetical protein
MPQEPLAPADSTVSRIAEQVLEYLRHNPLAGTPWRNPEDAARYLSLTRRGLEDMRGRGTGPKFHKVNDRVVRYHVRDLDAWLLSNGGGDA